MFAIVEHRYWVHALQRFLRGERRDAPRLDAHSCRFCQWLRHEESDRHTKESALQDIASLHDRAHRMAEELIVLHVRGETAEVEQGLNTLHDLNAELAETLYRLAHDAGA